MYETSVFQRVTNAAYSRANHGPFSSPAKQRGPPATLGTLQISHWGYTGILEYFLYLAFQAISNSVFSVLF